MSLGWNGRWVDSPIVIWGKNSPLFCGEGSNVTFSNWYSLLIVVS